MYRYLTILLLLLLVSVNANAALPTAQVTLSPDERALSQSKKLFTDSDYQHLHKNSDSTGEDDDGA